MTTLELMLSLKDPTAIALPLKLLTLKTCLTQLFRKIQTSRHIVVPVYMTSFLLKHVHPSHTLPERGHSFVLPQYDSNMFRFSFLIRCVFRFV